MAYGKISDKQREILEYIKKEILNKGYPPTVRDICEAVHLKSTSSVHSHLETLEKNGYIRRDPTKPRAIEIVDDNFNLKGLITIKDIEKQIKYPGRYPPVSRCLPLRILMPISRFLQSICQMQSPLC